MKRLSVIALALAVCVFAGAVFLVDQVSAAEKPTKVYDQVIKSGNNAYCIAGTGIFKVDIKTGAIKRLVKDPGEYGHYRQMCKKGKYLYYIKGGTDVRGDLYRVSINGGKTKHLAGSVSKGRAVTKYMIKKKKIFYKELNDSTGKNTTKKMKLNGKSKKRSKAKVKWQTKDTNAAGYVIGTASYEAPAGSNYYEMVQYWLVTPGNAYFDLGEKGFH